MTMQNPQARQFRQRPRPTHMWDPQRGVVPMDPNAPNKFVPPPPPEVVEAYMRGMARRQNVDTDMGQPGFPSSRANPIGASGLRHSERGFEGGRPIAPSFRPDPGYHPGDPGRDIRGFNPDRSTNPIPMGSDRGQQMSDQELRHFWPTMPAMPIPTNTGRPNRIQRY